VLRISGQRPALVLFFQVAPDGKPPDFLIYDLLFFIQITTYHILHTKYEYVKYYTKLSPENQEYSKKFSMR